MSTIQIEYPLPTNPADIEKLKKLIREGTDCETRMASEKEYKKELIADISEQFDIPKKDVGRMIKDSYANSFSKKAAQESQYQALFETVFPDECSVG